MSGLHSIHGVQIYIEQGGRWNMKRLALSLLVVGFLLLTACSAPKNTQTVTVSTTITLGPPQTEVATVTKTFTFTVKTTLTITGTSPATAAISPTTTTTAPTTTPGEEIYDISGTWSGDWWRSDGGEEGTLIATLTQSNGSLSGDMTFTSTTFQYSEETVISGSVAGSDVVFGMAIGESNGSQVTIDFDGTISEEGNRMSGTYSMSTGWTGTWEVARQ
jgi:hypothetical protein